MSVNGSCPNCGGEFVELERAGVRIDACRRCRGVWLDRGELEQLVEREQKVVAGADEDEEDFVRELTGRKREHSGDDEHSSGREHAKQRHGLDTQTAIRIFEDYTAHKSKSKHKRKSLLGELLG